MEWTCDLHTHTKWSDGKDSVARMAEAALEKGLSVLGISDHSPMPQPDDWSMPREDVPGWFLEMKRQRAAFAGRLTLLCALELDLATRDFPLTEYDYIIASVHTVDAQGQDSVDESEETTRRIIRESFGGDPYAYAKAYFARLAAWASRPEADIIGHADILGKFNEGGRCFDEEAEAYLCPAKEAVDALCRADKIFEINTGAISRGYRSVPYPGKTLLRFIRARGGRITFGSDAHAAAGLAFYFEEARALARACGFTSAVYHDGQGFAERAI